MPHLNTTQNRLSNVLSRAAVVAAMILGGLAACSMETDDHDPLIKRGKVVYQTNCTACHAPDPSLNGGMGPAVTGSSLELLTARIVHDEYPAGYEAKRKTEIMVALPFLEPELPALAAYLNQDSSRDSDKK